MDDRLARLNPLDRNRTGDVAAAISTLAWTNGVTADPDPIDTFVAAAARLSDARWPWTTPSACWSASPASA